MISGTLGFYTVLNTLLSEVYDELEAEGNAPDRTCVVPGAIAWDDCECGLLVGTISRKYLSENFPTDHRNTRPGIRPIACQAPYTVAAMSIVILRCAPQPYGESLAPSCDSLDQSAQEITIDAHITMNTVACRLEQFVDDDDIVDYLVNEQTFVGPEGMCVGSEQTFLVALPRE